MQDSVCGSLSNICNSLAAMVLGACLLGLYLRGQHVTLPPAANSLLSLGMVLWPFLGMVANWLNRPRKTRGTAPGLGAVAMPAGLASAAVVAMLVWNDRTPLPVGVLVLIVSATALTILLLIRFAWGSSVRRAK